MKTLKIGTVVRLTDSHREWLSEKADEIFNYPQGFPTNTDPSFFISIGGVPSLAEQLEEYFICRYSHERGLPMDGIIVGHNDNPNDPVYLVWFANELGQDLTYIDSKDLIVL